jgi:hypothetical protein
MFRPNGLGGSGNNRGGKMNLGKGQAKQELMWRGAKGQFNEVAERIKH